MALCTVFRIRPKIRLRRIFHRSRILAGFRKTAGFRPELEPKSGTALISTQSIRRKSYSYNSARPRDWNETEIKQPKRFTAVLAFVAVLLQFKMHDGWNKTLFYFSCVSVLFQLCRDHNFWQRTSSFIKNWTTFLPYWLHPILNSRSRQETNMWFLEYCNY